MSKTLRTLAAAALIAAGLPQVASAALVQTTIDFNGPPIADLTASNVYNAPQFGHATFVGSAATNGAMMIVPCPTSCAGDQIVDIVIGDLFHGSTLPSNPFGLAFDIATSQTVFFEILPAAGIIPLASGSIGDTDGDVFPIELLFDGQAKTIRFRGAATSFAVDNLTYTIDDAVVVNPTPEPASAALVALALVGAASVTRRRKTS